MNRYLTMKHSLLIVASASLFAASQWASAQAFNGAGGAAGDWEFRIGPVFQESKKVNFNGGSYADIDSSTGFKIGSGYHLTDQVIIGGNFGHGQSNFNGVVQSGTPGINAAVENGHVDFNTVPWVIYTWPEIAWVGQTEQQLKAAGIAYRAGSFPFAANGRARSLGDTTGFVKILADAATDRILGMHAIGPFVSELIAEGVVAMEFGAASEDLARNCHAHPTLSEVTKEAALAVDKRTINL